MQLSRRALAFAALALGAAYTRIIAHRLGWTADDTRLTADSSRRVSAPER